MDETWVEPSPRAAAAMRELCETLITEADDLIASLAPPARRAQADPGTHADAALAEENLRLDSSDVLHWLTSNIQHPGRRVEPHLSARSAEYIRDLAARGISPDFAEGWRVALGIGWRRLLETCVARYAGDPELLVELLDITARSMILYATDSVTMLQQARATAAQDAAEQDVLTLLQQIIDGGSPPEETVEPRLGYVLRREHRGCVLWVESPDEVPSLDVATASVRAAMPVGTLLAVPASQTSHWLWLSGSTAPDTARIEALLDGRIDRVRAAVGRPGKGIEGFRESLRDALRTQAFAIRLGTRRALTFSADVELIDPLTQDIDSARRFVRATLGELAWADSDLRRTLLVYVQSGLSSTRAAGRLYTHRNTVERRVSRAKALTPVSVEGNPTQVAAALAVLEEVPDLLRRNEGVNERASGRD
ncbi:CdaR family transcriptional regulator [Streptomyces sp. AC495_CC817]|uniref:PucR family transcriptional regulator n=1 Tax=Streptomyces sp. AC495_CC817 TaxID=2823900 RepID=UPI001C251E29|nr:helix-turn-helix domain-containing protein [Streptomyces sp. AC495_CC817]